VSDPTIETVRSSDFERAVSALVMAFASDPVMRWFWPEADDYLRNFPRFLRAFGGPSLDHQCAHADGHFRSAALWMPPGGEPDGEALAKLFQESLRDPVRSESFELLEQMEANHTKEPHYYLAVIGVDVRHQGSGLGSHLLRKQLDHCDAEGLHAFLESSNPANVPFYERHGFEVTAELQAGSSPIARSMLRTPGKG
jgi:ribosomal protein S18 acetylase RimI-like enzyme